MKFCKSFLVFFLSLLRVMRVMTVMPALLHPRSANFNIQPVFILRSDERISIYKMDIAELLFADSAFSKKYAGKLGFLHGDIPFGYFLNDPADIRWSQHLATLVATGAKRLLHGTGTILLKMGDKDADMWRTTFEQAGFTVERDRFVLVQRAPWMRRKAYITHADRVNGAHFWMVAHVHKSVYFQSQKPFGTGGREEGRVCVCVCVHVCVCVCVSIFFFFFLHLHNHTHTHTKHKGCLSTGGFPRNSNMFFDVPHVPVQFKLRTEDGRTVRIQETNLNEALELWHRYCNPDCLGLDLCSGTGVSIMAMLHLGLQGIVNERDAQAITLGEARARIYMDHLYKQNQYFFENALSANSNSAMSIL